jgi:hypothetical protein
MRLTNFGTRVGEINHYCHQYQNSFSALLKSIDAWECRLVGKMVYYFTSSAVIPKAFIYVGKDKVESMFFTTTERRSGRR